MHWVLPVLFYAVIKSAIQTFSIHCRPNAKTDSYRAEFRVDGRILYSCHAQPGRMIMSVGPSVEGNYRPYQFSRLLVNAGKSQFALSKVHGSYHVQTTKQRAMSRTWML